MARVRLLALSTIRQVAPGGASAIEAQGGQPADTARSNDAYRRNSCPAFTACARLT